MGYHQNALKGEELSRTIGKPTQVSGFDANDLATGASAAEFYGLQVGLTEGPAGTAPTGYTPT